VTKFSGVALGVGVGVWGTGIGGVWGVGCVVSGAVVDHGWCGGGGLELQIGFGGQERGP